MRHVGMLAAVVVLLWAQLAPAAELRFAIVDTPPYGFAGPKGPAGIYPAVLAALSAEAHIPITVSLVPFARAAHEVAAGIADGTIMFDNAITEGRAVALAPVFVTAQVLQLNKRAVLRSRKDLQALLIGRIRDGCQDLAADKATPWRFHELNSQRQGIDMLSAGRIDAFCSTPEAIDSAAMQFNLQQRIDPRNRWVISNKEVWMFVSRKTDPRLHEPLRAALRRLQQNGALARIFSEALGERFTVTLPKPSTWPDREGKR